MRRMLSLLLAASVLAAAPAGHAQAPSPAAAATGKPDFSGLWVVSNRSLRGHRDAALQPIKGEVYTAKAIAARKAAQPGRDPSAHCLPAMPRHMGGPYPIQIIQRPNMMALLFEYDNVFRIIYTDGRKPDPDATGWMGRSIGHWEGDTLVVETTGVNEEAWLDGEGTPVSPRQKITERFTLADGGKTLEVVLKVDDPEVFLQPVYRKLVYNLKNEWEIKDYVCNEGNRDSTFHGANSGSLPAPTPSP